MQADLREIVASLSDTQRAIVLADAAARDSTACSRTVGEELGLPAATVRVYRKRAMDRIRNELRLRGHDVPESHSSDRPQDHHGSTRAQ